MHATRAPVPATLIAALEAKGFVPGAPPQVTPAHVAVDRRLCHRLKCGNCPWQGMTFLPFHRGSRYRVVAQCPRCGWEEER